MDRRTYGVERLGALTDGVCAIAMTLLVLELKIPRPVGVDLEQEIIQSLLDQTSEFAAWIISFLLIARIWQELHVSMAGLERCDASLIALNIGALGACSLIPFGSALVGRFDEDPISVIVFSVIMMLNGILLAAVNSYIAWRREFLKAGELHARFRYKATYFGVAFGLVGVTSIALAFHHPLIGIAAWAAEPAVALLLVLLRTAPARA